jgi:hypothetical protein
MRPLLPTDPARIGRYELEGILGTGATGTVYLARSPGGRPVAIRVFTTGLLAEPDALTRFRWEAETLVTVRSAYAATLIDCELTDPPYWMATEYVPGPTLAATVAAEGPLPPRWCLQLMAALAEGLGDVHAYGISHRDLKPANVILSPTGPQLIDFGIPRTVRPAGPTRTGVSGFLAPEMMTSADPAPAVDVFALGATIANAATARSPYGDGTISKIQQRMARENIDVKGVDDDLATLIRSCVTKEPAWRPSAADIISWCRHLQQEDPGDPAAAPPDQAARSRKPDSSPPTVDMPSAPLSAVPMAFRSAPLAPAGVPGRAANTGPGSGVSGAVPGSAVAGALGAAPATGARPRPDEATGPDAGRALAGSRHAPDGVAASSAGSGSGPASDPVAGSGSGLSSAVAGSSEAGSEVDASPGSGSGFGSGPGSAAAARADRPFRSASGLAFDRLAKASAADAARGSRKTPKGDHDGGDRGRGRSFAVVGAAIAVAVLLFAGGALAALRFVPRGEETGLPFAPTVSASPSPSATPSASPTASALPSASVPPPLSSSGPATNGPVLATRTAIVSPTAARAVTTPTTADGRCIVLPDPTANGTRVSAAPCDGSPEQRWSLTDEGVLRSDSAARCLDVGGDGGAELGYRIQLWDCNLGEPQLWVAQSDGTLVNARSGRCLAVLPSGQGGPALSIATCTATADQRWRLPA